MRRPLVLAALAALAACASTKASDLHRSACRSSRDGIARSMFGGDRERTGWNARETELVPARVRGGMKRAWTSAPFERAVVGGIDYAGRAYASPLYGDGVRITKGPATGESMSVAMVATSNGDVHAIAAFDAACDGGSVKAGTLLWRTHLVTPGVPPRLDSGRDGAYPGIAVGTLATPAWDLASGTLYVTAMDAPSSTLPAWKIFALDVATGEVRPGWPLTFSRAAVEAANTNGPAYFDEDARFVSQRSALALSPEGDRVYVTFGGYWDEAVGWIVAVDARAPRILASFAGARDTLLDNGVRDRHANAGMWGPGGPAIDRDGRVHVTTGNSPPVSVAHAWGNAMLRLDRDLQLVSAYVPHDYCDLDRRDVDISGSSPVLLPGLDLVTFGGKAGVVYLLDRNGIPTAGEARPPCSTTFEDAARDASLLPPDAQEPYCDGYDPDPCVAPRTSTRCVQGPLAVFGPLHDDAAVDHAKMRTTPAFFRADDGTSYVYVSGSTKAARCSIDNVPPSIVRLRVATTPKPHLVRDGADRELRFVNPGSPIVSSNGGASPVVWVVDQNAKRTHPLLDPGTPPPVVYAVDGVTMDVLWRSAPGDLEPGGKYTTPLVAHGVLFVATDRLHAFAP